MFIELNIDRITKKKRRKKAKEKEEREREKEGERERRKEKTRLYSYLWRKGGNVDIQMPDNACYAVERDNLCLYPSMWLEAQMKTMSE